MGLFSFIYIGGTVYPKITLQSNIKLKVIASYEVKLDLKWANNSNSNNKLQKCSLSFSVNKDKHILGTLMGHSSKKQTMKSSSLKNISAISLICVCFCVFHIQSVYYMCFIMYKSRFKGTMTSHILELIKISDILQSCNSLSLPYIYTIV